MEINQKKIRKYLPYAAFGCAILWLFIQIYPIIFSVHDDLRNYVLIRRGIVMSDAVRMAKDGRISHLWNHILLTLPFLANKVWFYKLIQFAALFFDLFTLRLLLKTHIDRRFADLAVVLAVAWACISDQHNLLVAYALCHQLPFGFACLSLYHFGNRLHRGSKQETTKSCLFLLLAVMIYEAFAAVLLIMLLWAMLRRSRKPMTLPSQLRRAAGRMLPQLAAVGGYGILYCIWQALFPPVYSGITLNLHEPFLSFSALTAYSFGNFPLAEIGYLSQQTTITLTDFLGTLRNPLSWLTAIAASALFCITLPRIKLTDDALHNLLWISGCGIFAPCLAVACTKKYLEWRSSAVRAYLPSFYSYLVLVVFLTAAALRLYRSTQEGSRRKLLRGVMTAAVFGICLTATAVNAVWKPHFMTLSLRYRNFNQAVSAVLPNLTGTWQLYAPDNAGIHNSRDYTEDYLKIYNSGRIDYLTDARMLSDKNQILCIRMPENYAYTVAGNADSELRASKLTFRTLVPETFNITLYDTDGEAVYYENVKNGNILSLPEGKYFDLSLRVENTLPHT
ncbi:MAG: hypothetical protein IKQ91_04835 [Oscillospiraceae bacterium]|nr:hypothetical protein [Oscillospiraceae bacterium]